MLNKTIMASAAIAVALPMLTQDLVGSSEAEAKSPVQLAETKQLKLAPKKPSPPTRTPIVKPAKQHPGVGPYIDLYGEPYYQTGIEGLPGNYYCSPLFGNHKRPNSVRIKVRNQGNKTAGPVQVVFDFNGGKKEMQTLPMNLLAANYIFEAKIPPNAWKNGSANFTIRIDHPNKVAERNEKNNTYSSHCLEPQT
ncbi:CARDB domain-containing protein [Pelagibius sp. Alg239-R121]|uniref:CARDB domain-containing protein n=1 Tax=Pelagibius sp. Alg239-R121 TaxID=2993448 RepID=UPI0024A66D52|nr:CARDB domain-containing protein [Pelagibius sp. Alg239-R121]